MCIRDSNYCIPTYKSTGVEILLHQSIAHPCWITLIVNPSSLLAGTYQPVSLYQPDKKSLRKLHKRLRGILDKVGIEQRLRAVSYTHLDVYKRQTFLFCREQWGSDVKTASEPRFIFRKERFCMREKKLGLPSASSTGVGLIVASSRCV